MKSMKLDKLNKILVTRTDKIGDVILATPVLIALRKKFPDSFISMLVKPYTKEIVENNPYINEVIVDDFSAEFKGVLKLASLLKKKKFDVVVILFPSWRIAFSTFLARIPIRIGSGYRMYSFLFNKRVYIHRSRVEKHEVEYNFDLVSYIGVKFNKEKCSISLEKSDLLFADEFFKTKGLNNNIVVAIHPGSGGSALNWQVENYAKLADILIEEKNVKILITGNNEDKEIVEKMSRIMYKEVVKLKEKITVRQLGALIQRCSLFISASTGPMHIAASLGIPTLSFFCPIHVCSPVRWGPWANKNISLIPEGLHCKFCIADECNYYNCMERITVEEARGVAIKLLKEEVI